MSGFWLFNCPVPAAPPIQMHLYFKVSRVFLAAGRVDSRRFFTFTDSLPDGSRCFNSLCLFTSCIIVFLLYYINLSVTYFIHTYYMRLIIYYCWMSCSCSSCWGLICSSASSCCNWFYDPLLSNTILKKVYIKTDHKKTHRNSCTCNNQKTMKK